MWYQLGLAIDLATVVGDGEITALLAVADYDPEPTDDWDLDIEPHEVAGGSYTRVSVDGVTVDDVMDDQLRLMVAAPLLFARPTSAPGWVVLIRTDDNTPIFAAKLNDDGASDPIEVAWAGGVLGIRSNPGALTAAEVAASQSGHTHAIGTTVQAQLSALDAAVPVVPDEVATWLAGLDGHNAGKVLAVNGGGDGFEWVTP